jgi:hypothetical protein
MMRKDDIIPLLSIIFIDLPISLWNRVKKWYRKMQEEDIKKMI